ncbi:MAG: patatin-like phospholipase family protein [Burkholderiaceae bacterium]
MQSPRSSPAASTSAPSPFEQVVFAGGGNRCWWQAGFWDVVAPAIALKPRVIAGVSAGAATACMLYANDSRWTMDYYREALKHNRRNAYWGNLFRRAHDPADPHAARVFPHAAIYRKALTDILGGAHFERLKADAPEIRIGFARLPRGLGPHAALAVGIVVYNVEKYWRRSLHPTFGRRIGFAAEVARMQDCDDIDDLVSLITASSCTPPFTPIEHRGGRPTLDGGMVDNVPVDAVDAGPSTLVLLTRRYPGRPEVFTHCGRSYVQPSSKVAISAWDYTDVAAMQATYDQGRRDGERFYQSNAWRR